MDMAEPSPVEVKNEEPIKVEVTGGDKIPLPDPPPATTSEVHQTVVSSQAAEVYHWYGNPKFDDWIRLWLSTLVVGGFVFMVLYGQVTGRQPSQGVVEVYVAFVATCLGFYLGSSYGSNAKSKTGIV